MSSGRSAGSNASNGSKKVGGNIKSEVKTEPGFQIKREGEDGPSSSNGLQNGRPKKEQSPPPPTTYRDIPLLSSTLDDWRYHLMRLQSHAVIDPSDPQRFPFPVKLNRKYPPKLKDPLPHAGDPVIDQFGKPVLVPAQRRDPSQPNQQPLTPAERKRIPLLWPGPDDDVHEIEELVQRLETPKGPQADASLIGPSNSSNNATRAKAGLFKKRVREIHKASAEARKTHNEEVLPWILEDYETSKEWESRRKESRRGLKALQQGIKVRRKGGRFPSLPKREEEGLDAAGVKKEDPDGSGIKADPESLGENHAPWIGKMEGEAHESASTSAGGATSHALFVFDERDAGGFRVVPVSRMYKFLQKPKHANDMSYDEAEKAFEKQQKSRTGEGGQAWANHTNRIVTGPGAFNRGGNAGNAPRDYTSASIYRHLALPGSGNSQSSRPNVATIYDRDSSARRNQFVAVSSETKRGIRVKDEEGTYGENAFEEDFADDEERNEGDDFAMGEEETRELEQRLKREMARAEEQDEEDDDLFDDPTRPGKGENDVLTGSGQQMKKIMKALARREGNDIYDENDEDRNPYLSDDSDGGEETVMANPEEALRRVREEKEREAREAAKNNKENGTSANGTPAANGSNTDANTANPSVAQSKVASKEASRSGTPVPRPGDQRPTNRPMSGSQHRPGAGHVNLAQRATSPHAHSRQGSRSGSPVLDNTSPSSSLKRKSEAPSGSAGGVHTPTSANSGKRMRTGTGGSTSNPVSPGNASPRSGSPSRGSVRHAGTRGGSPQPLTELEREIVQLVNQGKAKTTKELIGHFSARLNAQNPSAKKSFSEAFLRVLYTKKPEGTLAVRAGIME
ncbi:uncharacterized protein FA14DRAFT_41092 [Meira miltonrushii]|uniref:Uncharacterized protein n=1 Tax=Meira miltonrushii TaxID=1280837 RepID=A0A316VGF2_9BASI|nr:uncharacterized protein FA14DRAFT_41092 [Meira miltonrushii]PWN35403.1 hypothetical protein FA14DRAFT_41092 [Meira miltonrushii]